jgi:hypothetical protein
MWVCTLVEWGHSRVSPQRARLGREKPLVGIRAIGRLWWVSRFERTELDFLDNQTAKTGVPTLMRTVVLLKRKDGNPFQCVVKTDARVDIKSTFKRVFG